MTIVFDTSRRIIGPTTATSFKLAARPRANASGGTPGMQSTVGHTLFDTDSGSVVDNEWDVSTQIGFLCPSQSCVLSSLNPTVATIDAAGQVTRVADGTANIRGDISGLQPCVQPLAVSRSGSTKYTFNSFTAGSLEKSIDDRINGAVTDGTDRAIFSTRGTDAVEFVRNTSLWLQSVDLTGIAAYSDWFAASFRPYVFLPMMVSSRHFITAAHISSPPDGQKFWFVKSDNTRVGPYTCAASYNVAGTDILVGDFGSNVAAGIGFARVLPANYASYLPGFTSSLPYRIPVCQANQFGNLCIADWIGNPNKTIWSVATTGLLSPYYKEPEIGDSGTPVFAVINNVPVLVCSLTGSTEGPSIADNIAAINTIMTAHGSKTLTQVDLSGFTT